MNDLEQQLRGLFSKKGTKKNAYGAAGVRPGRDCEFILAGLGVVLLAACIGAFSIYMRVENGTFSAAVPNTAREDVKINAALLRKMGGEIADRQSRWTAEHEKAAQAADPSL
jgi:hypothetical protein